MLSSMLHNNLLVTTTSWYVSWCVIMMVSSLASTTSTTAAFFVGWKPSSVRTTSATPLFSGYKNGLFHVGNGDALGYHITTTTTGQSVSSLSSSSNPSTLVRKETAFVGQSEDEKDVQVPSSPKDRPPTSTTYSSPKSSSYSSFYDNMMATTQTQTTTQTTPPPDTYTPKPLSQYYENTGVDLDDNGVVSNFPLLMYPGNDVDFWKTSLEFQTSSSSSSSSSKRKRRQQQQDVDWSHVLPSYVHPSQSQQLRHKEIASNNHQDVHQRRLGYSMHHPSSLTYQPTKRTATTMMTSAASTSTTTGTDENKNPQSSLQRTLMMEAQRDYKLIMGLQHTTPIAMTTSQPSGTKLDCNTATSNPTTATSSSSTPPSPSSLRQPSAVPTQETSLFHEMTTKQQQQQQQQQRPHTSHTKTQVSFLHKASTWTSPTTSYIRPYQATNHLLFPDRDMEDLLYRTK